MKVFQLFALLFFASTTIAADPEPATPLTAEQRKEVVEAYKRLITERINHPQRAGSIASLKEVIKKTTDAKSKEGYAQQLKAFEDPQAAILAEPVKYGPFGGISKGVTGIVFSTVQFKKILDKHSALVTIGEKGVFYDVFLDGLDTSKYSDDTRINLGNVWYCTGNTKVNDKTVFRLANVNLTPDELAELKAFKPVVAKKK